MQWLGNAPRAHAAHHNRSIEKLSSCNHIAGVQPRAWNILSRIMLLYLSPTLLLQA
jgi:hypothetical protein